MRPALVAAAAAVASRKPTSAEQNAAGHFRSYRMTATASKLTT